MTQGESWARRRLIQKVGQALAFALGSWGLGATQATNAFAAARSTVVEGVAFESQLQLGGTEVVLNGVGVRAVAWVKGYAAALYLTRRSNQMAGVLSAPGPKRLRLHMLMDVPATEFSKAFDKGVRRNVVAAELPALLGRMEQFEEVILGLKTVRKGDTIDLDYDPTRGLVLQLNGKLQGSPVPGADFYSALLRSFIGEQPYDKALRAGLLGAQASNES